MPTRFTMKRSLIQQRFALPKVRVYLEIAQKGNPDQFLFWDGIHPATAAHKILATVLTM